MIHTKCELSASTCSAMSSRTLRRTGAFKRRSVNQPGMQNDAGADSGERNAEHQGDEVFVHGEPPWRLSSAILLSPSLQSANPRECELPHACFRRPFPGLGVSTEQPFRNEAARRALKGHAMDRSHHQYFSARGIYRRGEFWPTPTALSFDGIKAVSSSARCASAQRRGPADRSTSLVFARRAHISRQWN